MLFPLDPHDTELIERARGLRKHLDDQGMPRDDPRRIIWVEQETIERWKDLKMEVTHILGLQVVPL